MTLSRKMRLVTLCLFLTGLSVNVLAQGNGRVRVLRVRKTGEFGKRIEPIATYYQPPTRHFRGNEPRLETSETRRFSRVIGIRKPSQQLQLPVYTQADQEPQETVESPQGYAYPNPPKRRGGGNKPLPVAEYPAYPESEEEQQSLDEPPNPVSPVIEAEEAPEPGLPFGVETQENIDADQSEPPRAEDVTPVRDDPQAEIPAKCNENDQDCWPHGYGGEIPGEAGIDYPILSEIVDTRFNCDIVQYSGYYADADDQARCQIFHVCLKGNQYRKTQMWSFLCPNGTVFSQNDFVCVWWNSAPECNSGVVDELSLRNAELGWDNLTEVGSNSAGSSSNFDVKSAMSNLFNANLQPSSSNSRLKNALPEPTTTRRPYRVPVKVNTGSGARTKLKEVHNNGLQQGLSEYPEGFEHDGEESEAYETSLSQQSEAQRKSKTASALLKSESEAYEQKSVPDSVAPLIVNRAPEDSFPNIAQEGGYKDEEDTPGLVMMQAQQRSPDGSDGFADVPVMMTGGYRYPNPTSTPGPKYLPPRNEYSSPSTTEPPTTSTQLPSTEESYESDQYQTTEESSQPPFSPQISDTFEQPGYKYPNPTTTEESGYDYSTPTTTEQSGYNYPVPSTTEQSDYDYRNPTTTEQSGYNYPTPTTTDQSSYSYPNPTSTEQSGYTYPTPATTEQSGYNYPTPATTEQSGYNYPTPTTTGASYQEEGLSSPVYEEQPGGYEQESTNAPKTPDRMYLPVTEKQIPVPAEVSSNADEIPEGGYLPPKIEGGYDSPRAAAFLKAAADIIALPNAADQEDDKSSVTNPTVPESSSDYIDDGTDLTTLEGNDVTGEGYGEKVTLPYHIPTPASEAPAAENLDPEQEKVNEILKQIQSGGAEVRDESGNKVDLEVLKKLLSSPSGLLALHKADQPPSTTDSSTSPSTEIPSTGTITSTTPEVQAPTLEKVQGIEEFNDNRAPLLQTYVENRDPLQQTYVDNRAPLPQTYVDNRVPLPQTYVDNRAPLPQTYVDNRAPQQQNYFSTQSVPQQSYFSNDRIVSIQHPTFAIKAPTKEFESHTVQQNSIDSSLGSQENTFSSGLNQHQSQLETNDYQRPQNQVYQNFAPTKQSLNDLSYQSTYGSQQSLNSGSNVNYVRPSVSQPELYYQQQVQQRATVSQDSRYFQTEQPQSQSLQNTPQSEFNPYYDQQHSLKQQPFFQEKQTQAPQYLPPPASSSQSQIYSPAPTQSRAPPRDLTDNIQLQQSFTFPVPQTSSISNNGKAVNPLDIKIVPAVFVHQHTRVENPDGSPITNSASQRSNIYQRPSNNNERSSALNFNNNNSQFRQFQPNNSPYNVPYASQTENRPVSVRAPRTKYNTFSHADALPQYEPFTAEDGRTAEQIQQYHHADLRKFRQQNVKPTQSASMFTTSFSTSLPVSRRNGRHFIGSSGSRGELEMPSEQSSVSNFYSGRDASLGVRLTYN